jgi:hypothetical protein|tara:strand:+ start:3709 stop:4404 length:696 start_codon:yes stop_codon:yes gene_type:complete
MRLHELLEARVEPDQDFLAQLEEIVDESIAEYQEFLEENNDVDDIDELEAILNSNNVDELPIEFITDHAPRKDPNEWISAVADWDEKEGKTITIYLHAKNLEKVYGPKSFKNILMRMLGHETIHWNQYDKMGAKVLNNYKSGYQKGVIKKASGGDERDLMRSYLRDPHELMAYAHDLAGEMKETDNPEEALRNPEKYKAELPVYERFREIFPPNAKQLRQLLKYTADYFKV